MTIFACRRLLVDAQSKFRKMVDDNQRLAARIDGSIQAANQEVRYSREVFFIAEQSRVLRLAIIFSHVIWTSVDGNKEHEQCTVNAV